MTLNLGAAPARDNLRLGKFPDAAHRDAHAAKDGLQPRAFSCRVDVVGQKGGPNGGAQPE
jgi:hypothetical protein